MEESLNAFIQVSAQNQEANNQRMDSLEASIKRVETQVGQLAGQLQENQKGKLPSQPQQAMSITVLRSGEVIDDHIDELSNEILLHD